MQFFVGELTRLKMIKKLILDRIQLLVGANIIFQYTLKSILYFDAIRRRTKLPHDYKQDIGDACRTNELLGWQLTALPVKVTATKHLTWHNPMLHQPQTTQAPRISSVQHPETVQCARQNFPPKPAHSSSTRNCNPKLTHHQFDRSFTLFTCRPLFAPNSLAKTPLFLSHPHFPPIVCPLQF